MSASPAAKAKADTSTEYVPEILPDNDSESKHIRRMFPREVSFYRDPSREPSWRIYTEFKGELAQKLGDSDKQAIQNLVDSLTLSRRTDLEQRKQFVIVSA